MDCAPGSRERGTRPEILAEKQTPEAHAGRGGVDPVGSGGRRL